MVFLGHDEKEMRHGVGGAYLVGIVLLLGPGFSRGGGI